MKSAVLLIAVLALGSCTFFAPVPEVDFAHELTLSGNQSNLASYFNGLWGYYGLVQTEAANCFTNAQATAYFTSIGYQYQYTGALYTASRTQAAYYAGLIQALNGTLAPAMQCLFNTSDLHMLLYQAGITFFNQTLFEILNGIYFQGRFDDWYLAFTPVYTQLFNHQYTEAGYTYGPILYQQINNASAANGWKNAIGGFENALFFDYNITSPTEFSDCYNEYTAEVHMSFYYFWAQTVHNSTVDNVVNNTFAYFAGQGRELFVQSEPTIACLDRTDDQVRLDTAVGTMINSPEWWDYTHNYIANYPSTYFSIFNQMYNQFENYNPGYAGYLYGTFIYAVNASISSQVEA